MLLATLCLATYILTSYIVNSWFYALTCIMYVARSESCDNITAIFLLM